MSFKRISAVLLAAVISAGACSVPAFAFTGETSETVVQDAAPAPAEDAGKETSDTDEKKGETETADQKDSVTLHIRTEDGSIIVSFGDGENDAVSKQIGTVVTNGSRLNARSGGGLDYEILDQLRPGEQVEVVSVEGDWLKVIVPEKTGYVYKDYLRIQDQPQPGISGIDIPEEYMTMFLQLLGQGGGNLPLTPDGNLTLVDDIGHSTGAGKQFVTLVTKSGNYFYLIIDRDEKGNENVHFLNQVDEADLFSLMDEDDAAAMKEKIVSEDAEKQQTSQPAVTPTEPTETEKDPEPQPEQKSKLPYALGLVALLGICGGGGAFCFLKNKKQNEAAADRPDPDADYREDDDGYDIPEEAEDEEDYDESEDE